MITLREMMMSRDASWSPETPALRDSAVSVAGRIEPPLATVRVCRISGSSLAVQPDVVAVEEPLEIRLGCDDDGRRVHRAVSITMRTPGHDLELAVGVLFTEGILTEPEQVESVRACGRGNVARVELRPGVAKKLTRLERHSYMSSSCGVCGKVNIYTEADRIHLGPTATPLSIDSETRTLLSVV